MTQGQLRGLMTVLVADHREMEQLLGELESLPAGGDGSRIRTVLEQVVFAMVRHTVLEERYLYPLVGAYVLHGRELVDEDIADHAGAEHLIRELEGLPTGDERFWTTVRALIAEIRRHFADEEKEVFPRVRSACPVEKLRALGAQAERAKLATQAARIRAEPGAPDTSAAGSAPALDVGLAERLRDTISRRILD